MKCHKCGEKAVINMRQHTLALCKEDYLQWVPEQVEKPMKDYVLTHHTSDNLATDVLVGMGGGKTIDTAKIVADRAGIPVIIVPTNASTDAPCSGCAVRYSEAGIFDCVFYQKMKPAAVLVDIGIIAAAPTRFLGAGMGDALSTWFEARSCDRTQSPNECGGYSTTAGLRGAETVRERIG